MDELVIAYRNSRWLSNIFVRIAPSEVPEVAITWYALSKMAPVLLAGAYK